MQKLGQWIENNAWGVLAAGSTLLTGYAVGQSNMTNRMDQLAQRVSAVEDSAKKAAAMTRCQTLHIALLESGVKAPPACVME